MTFRTLRALRLLVPLAVASPIVGALSLGACSNDPEPAVGEDDGGGVDGSASKDGSTTGEDGATTEDASTTDAPVSGDACVPDSGTLPPVLDGGNPCSALSFGLPAAVFGAVQGDGGSYAGGTIPAGIYDAVLGERQSRVPGSWRETFVVDGAGKFTRIRQIAITEAGPGPIQYRAGTYAVTGNEVKFTYTCAVSPDGGAIDGGSDTLPFEVVRDGCNAPVYRYGVFGIRLTLRPR